MIAVVFAGLIVGSVSDPIEANEVALWNRTLIDFTLFGFGPATLYVAEYGLTFHCPI